MVNLDNEHAIDFTKAARLFGELRGSDRPAHISTLHRYRLRGLHGVCLESAIVAGVRVTTREAVIRFIRAVNAARMAAAPDTPAPRPATDEDDVAKELDDRGIK